MDRLTVAVFFRAPTQLFCIKDLLNPGSRQNLKTGLLFDPLHYCRRAESERTKEVEDGHEGRIPFPIFNLPYGRLVIAGEKSQLISGQTQ